MDSISLASSVGAEVGEGLAGGAVVGAGLEEGVEAGVVVGVGSGGGVVVGADLGGGEEGGGDVGTKLRNRVRKGGLCTRHGMQPACAALRWGCCSHTFRAVSLVYISPAVNSTADTLTVPLTKRKDTSFAVVWLSVQY